MKRELSGMRFIANLFGQTREILAEYERRCNELGRAIAKENGLCRVEEGRRLPPKTKLGASAETIFSDFKVWFETQTGES